MPKVVEEASARAKGRGHSCRAFWRRGYPTAQGGLALSSACVPKKHGRVPGSETWSPGAWRAAQKTAPLSVTEGLPQTRVQKQTLFAVRATPSRALYSLKQIPCSGEPRPQEAGSQLAFWTGSLSPAPPPCCPRQALGWKGDVLARKTTFVFLNSDTGHARGKAPASQNTSPQKRW